MNTHTNKIQVNKSKSVANIRPHKQTGSECISQFVDNRPEACAQRAMQEIANNSPQTKQIFALHSMFNRSFALQKQLSQKNEINTSLPDRQEFKTTTIQRRIKDKDGKEYSFLKAHDINGNPFLASKELGNLTKNWQFNENQPGINIEEVNSLAIPFSEEKSDRIKHNLSFGRQQVIKLRNQEGIIEPFKSYQFGYNKMPDVSVYNLGESGPGKKYSDYKKELHKKLKFRDLPKNRNEKLDLIEDQMFPLIFGEDYRTAGAMEEFSTKWKLLKEHIEKDTPEMPSDRKRKMEETEKEKEKRIKLEMNEWRAKRRKWHKERNKLIDSVTKGLSFAGTRGKKKGREEIQKNKEKKDKKTYKGVEQERGVLRTDMSPNRASPGFFWDEQK